MTEHEKAPPPSTYVSINDAAELAGVQRRTITKWLTNEKITRYTAANGYSVLINREELAEFVRQHRTSPAAPGHETPIEQPS